MAQTVSMEMHKEMPIQVYSLLDSIIADTIVVVPEDVQTQ